MLHQACIWVKSNVKSNVKHISTMKIPNPEQDLAIGFTMFLGLEIATSSCGIVNALEQSDQVLNDWVTLERN